MAISTNNIVTEIPQLLLIVSILTHVIVKESTHEQNIKKQNGISGSKL